MRDRGLRGSFLLALTALCAGLVWGAPRPARSGGEQYYEENPAPESVEDEKPQLEQEADEEIEEPPEPRSETVRDRVRGLPIFSEDGYLRLKLRSYYLYGKELDNSRIEAWTYGAHLRYESGWIRDRLLIGGAYYTSNPIHAPSDRDGTNLLKPNQRPFRVLGQAYLRLRLAPGHRLTLYRQVFRTPFINPRDGRMAPQTFEGYAVRGTVGGQENYPRLQYIGGYLTRFKARNDDRFVPMSDPLAPGTKRGTWVGGALFSPNDSINVGAINYYAHDVLNITHAEASKTWRPSDAVSVRTTLRVTDQRSVGDDLIDGTDFSTQQVASSLALSYKGAILRVASSTTSNDRGIVSPWGSKPSPVSLMLADFDRAGEEGWLVGGSYNFRRIGIPGLSFFTNYARGHGARDATTGLSLPQNDEFNLTVDYRIDEGPLRGLWFRVRGAFLHQRDGGSESQNQLRVIVNYDLPLL